MAKRKYRKYDSANEIIDEIYSDFCVVCKGHIISKQAVHDMASLVSWELTELNGKFEGCKYWTKKALEVYKNSKSKPKKDWQKELIHEHVIPRKFLIDYIMSCYDKESEPEKKYFDLVIACVVTKEENNVLNKKYKSLMPGDIKDIEDITEINRWERYIQSEISDIREVKWDNARNYESDEEVDIKHS